MQPHALYVPHVGPLPRYRPAPGQPPGLGPVTGLALVSPRYQPTLLSALREFAGAAEQQNIWRTAHLAAEVVGLAPLQATLSSAPVPAGASTPAWPQALAPVQQWQLSFQLPRPLAAHTWGGQLLQGQRPWLWLATPDALWHTGARPFWQAHDELQPTAAGGFQRSYQAQWHTSLAPQAFAPVPLATTGVPTAQLPAPGLALLAAQANLAPGGTATYTVQAQAANCSQPLQFSWHGMPYGVRLAPGSPTSGLGAVTLTLQAGPVIPTGQYNLVLRGAACGAVAYLPLTLFLTA